MPSSIRGARMACRTAVPPAGVVTRGRRPLFAFAGLALLAVMMTAGRPLSRGFVEPSGPRDRRPKQPDAKVDQNARKVENNVREATSAPSDQHMENLFTLASFLFWAVFIQFVVVEDHYLKPKEAYDSALIQGLGGHNLPLHPKD